MQRYRRIILSIMIFLLASLAGCSSCNDPHGSPVPDSSLAPASDTPSDKPTAASEFAYAYGTCVSGVDISGMTKAEAIEALQKAEGQSHIAHHNISAGHCVGQLYRFAAQV